MSKPDNPKTTVLVNQHYRSGLNEGDIWKHYQKYKSQLLKELDGHPVVIFFLSGLNDIIVKRNIMNRPIVLTSSNYDNIISGRTLTISKEILNNTDYFVLDIDCKKDITEFEKRNVVSDILDFVENNSLVKSSRVSLTGNGYHVYGYMNKKMNKETILKVIEKELKMRSDGSYDVNKKNSGSAINVDLTPMYNRGSHTAIYALNRNGLMCVDVTNNWQTFRRDLAKIRR